MSHNYHEILDQIVTLLKHYLDTDTENVKMGKLWTFEVKMYESTKKHFLL